MDISRILNFWILPVTVVGNSVGEADVARDLVGRDLAAAELAQISSAVAAWPSRSRTHAQTSSPYSRPARR